MRQHAGIRGLAALLVAGAFATSGLTDTAHAAGPVTSYAIAPFPIGTEATTGVATAVTVTVVAKGSTGTPVPSASIYLAFKQASGGGTATVGATPLRLKPVAFTADSSGTVAITYRTPSAFPASGTDEITAQNGPTLAGSTITSRDGFTFTTATAMSFSPNPIANARSLAAGTTVTVTLSALRGTAPAAGASVWLLTRGSTGGGTFTCSGITLTATPTRFTADGTGRLTVTYRTATTLPAAGLDVLFAQGDPTKSTVHARDDYRVG